MRSSVNRALATTFAGLLGGLLAACSPAASSPRAPTATLHAYAAALRQGDAEGAYRLLSRGAKRGLSLKEFRGLLKDNPEDVAEIARALARPGSKPVVTATVTASTGQQLKLLYDGKRWTVDKAGINPYGHDTPRRALLGFLRAFERRRYDILMRYVPDAERAGTPEALWGSTASTAGLNAEMLEKAWSGEQKEYIGGIVEAIKSALPTARIEETEDRASMPYGAGGSVLFVRENGLWKIGDLK